jgi:hypothetical protein
LLNPTKEANQLVKDVVEIAQCPHCERVTTHLYFMQDATTKVQSKWYACSCGVVWQTPYPDYKYGRKYLDNLPIGQKWERSNKYVVDLVAPTIEELMYGRKMLMVGHNEHQAAEFKRRGWVCFTIDKNECFATTNRFIAADFETFEFASDVKYNLIWFYQTLESLHNPFEALKKSQQLLAEDGIIFIATPDTDFIYTRSPSGFAHWKRDYNHILWNKKALISYLEKQGLNVVYARSNYERRLPAWDDLWIIAQKVYY